MTHDQAIAAWQAAKRRSDTIRGLENSMQACAIGWSLIDEAGRMAARETCRKLWRLSEQHGITVSINLAGDQMTLAANKKPPAEVLAMFAAHKAIIMEDCARDGDWAAPWVDGVFDCTGEPI